MESVEDLVYELRDIERRLKEIMNYLYDLRNLNILKNSEFEELCWKAEFSVYEVYKKVVEKREVLERDVCQGEM